MLNGCGRSNRQGLVEQASLFFCDASAEDVREYIRSGVWPGEGSGPRPNVLPYNPAAMQAIQDAMGG